MKNKIMLLLAAAALVTACGGGGGSDGASTAAADGNLAPANTGGATGVGGGSGTQPADTNTPPSSSNPGPGAGDTGTPPGTTQQPPGTGTAADQQLAGYLSMVGNQLVYIRTDRSIYHAVTLNQFESDQGMFDIASGSKQVSNDTLVPAPVAAPAAPIAALGFRVNKFVQRATEGQAVGNQTVVGRVAVSLVERAGSRGILANEAAENMQFVIDKVELSTNQNGELISARALEGAQMHITGRNAANVAVQETVSVPAGAVRLLPMTEVLDHYGDDSSVVLLLDLEAAFSQAGQRLTALENIAGQFAAQVTISSAQIIRPSAAATEESPVLERKELVGQAITVGSQPAVRGAGISGNAWIRMYPE
jgi:hypothetical protein